MDSARTMHLISLASGAMAAVASIVTVVTATSGVTPEGAAACVVDPGCFCCAAGAMLLCAWASDRGRILGRTGHGRTSGQGA
ncbi:hypothetical protein [Caniella muris]|uniref:hypothetical protein n=1 Tax=Caniella muris TaxID=2941502 RepID=UPI00203E05E6|nr:hypothetical protein [Caniella muris]